MGRAVAFVLYLLFVASWFLHLTARLPVLGTLRLDLSLVILIATLLILTREDAAIERSDRRVFWAVTSVVLFALLAIPFAQWPGSAVKAGLPAFLKAIVFYYFTVALLTSPKRLRWLLLVFVGCQAFRVLEPTYLHVTTGYWGSVASMGWERLDRLAGAPFDVVNPNGLAFVILTVICFVHYLAPLAPLGRLFHIVFLPVAVYALALTGSRSGAVGLAIVLLALLVKSRHKVPFLALVVVTGFVAVPWLSVDLKDRYRSIFDTSTRNAATASGRLNAISANFAVAMRRPVFGHGLGTSSEANVNFGGGNQRAHNLYAEVSQELGFLGLAVFLRFLLILSVTAWRAPVRLRTQPVPSMLALRLGSVLQVWLAMTLVFSLASYGLSSYELYFLAALTEVVSGTQIVSENSASTSDRGAIGPIAVSRW